MKVSFVVPVLNGASTLPRCLDSIVTQTLTLPREIIVVDNGSTDGSPEIARTFGALVLHEETPGAASARNTGWQAAQGEFIAFVDCDVVLANDWAEVLLSEMDTMYAAIQGQIKPTGSGNRWLDSFRLKRAEDLHSGSFLNMVSNGKLTPMINTAASLFRRSVLVLTNGFDPRLRSCEDTEFSIRLFLSGHGLKATSRTLAHVYYDFDAWNYLRRSGRIGYWTARFQKLYGKQVFPAYKNEGLYSLLNSILHCAGWLLGMSLPSSLLPLPMVHQHHAVSEQLELSGIAILCGSERVLLHQLSTGRQISIEGEEKFKRIFVSGSDEQLFLMRLRWLSSRKSKDHTSSLS